MWIEWTQISLISKSEVEWGNLVQNSRKSIKPDHEKWKRNYSFCGQNNVKKSTRVYFWGYIRKGTEILKSKMGENSIIKGSPVGNV